MNSKWKFLISEFRSLGGIAENICQKEGKRGRGIFSENPNLKSRIFTPTELMVRKEDIYVDSNKLRIKKDKEYSPKIRDFFNYYQDNFSWGGGGKNTTDSFEKGLSSFSPELKELIKTYLFIDLVDRHKGEWINVVKNQFLNSRAVKFGKYSVIAPIWDLVNHEVISLPFIKALDGISTPNYPPMDGEITFSYNSQSSLNRFFLYGFFSKESIVFSFPFSINLHALGIKFECKGKQLCDDSMKIQRSNNLIIVEGLPLVAVNNPRLSIEYFDEIIRRISDVDIPKYLFSKILELNIAIRKNIIEESQLVDNELSDKFSDVVRYEMKLISNYD